jgi:hypothetical protein
VRRSMKTTWWMLLSAGLWFMGCGTAPKVEQAAEAPKPELTINVASLNLSGLNKRIERTDISRLWQALKKEQVEVLALQNVSRYPGVETRIDPIEELAKQADWRKVFGETADFSGRQVGNAVLAAYPIRSSSNQPFTGVRSALNDGSLQAVVDGGVKDLLVVSAQLPPKASSADQARCVSIIRNGRGDDRLPMILMGNLPSQAVGFTGIDGAGTASTRVLYDGLGTLVPTSSSTVQTALGTMVIVRFAVFRQPT